MEHNTLALIILDGWGIAPKGPGNAISLAKTPVFDRFFSSYPHTQLAASGEAVGLPRGEDGNSETGHLNLGAGRIVYQDLPRINMAIADESFYHLAAFKTAAQHVKKYQSRLHLLGLIGAGGVHSSMEHLFALLLFAKREELKEVYLHLFTDGRDSPPTSAQDYLDKVEIEIRNCGLGQVATLCGRYFAMDRDNRWDRTQKAYELLVMGQGETAPNTREAIKRSYENQKTDEFLAPVLVNQEGIIKDNDAVVFFNFRVDRPRQLTKALVLPDFEKLETGKVAFDPYAEKYGLKQYQAPKGTTTFQREKILKNILMVTMTEFEKGLPVQVAFPHEVIEIPLAQVLSMRGLRQFHLSETEKERFVTYYFNGQREKPFEGEEQQEIPSPRVATYDLKPEMAAYEVTEVLLKKIKMNLYNFIVVNYANPDMVGHTGDIKAAIRACEVVDESLGKVLKTLISLGGTALITADHGNIEEMIDAQTGEVDTKHSTNLVPFIIVNETLRSAGKTMSRGILADVTPTILSLLGLRTPPVMTGRNLIQ